MTVRRQSREVRRRCAQEITLGWTKPRDENVKRWNKNQLSLNPEYVFPLRHWVDEGNGPDTELNVNETPSYENDTNLAPAVDPPPPGSRPQNVPFDHVLEGWMGTSTDSTNMLDFLEYAQYSAHEWSNRHV